MSENGNPLRFQSLEFRATPWSRFAWSLTINAALVAALIAIPVTVERVNEPSRRLLSVTLAPPVPARVKPVQTPAPAPPASPRRQTQFHAPPPKPSEPKVIAVPPVPVETPKPLEALRLEPPKIEIPARPTIKQDVFPLNTAPAVSPDAPPKAVRTGGFGNPNGASPSASTNKGFAAPAVGAFDSPAGSAVGKSQSGSGKLVASAGFGGVSQGPVAGSSASHGSVHGAGFGDYDQSAAPPRTLQTARAAAPVETPVEITFKPRPAYTAEAREKKIEGEVLLEVQFGSDGQIRVLHLLHGLGYGLDENARAAAGQIRFHPGTRNGTPVDVTGTVHISFELS